MTSRISILIIFFVQCSCERTNAQSATAPLNTYLNNFVQPPPTAASLGKYADFPVGYYTGVPNINIPLYNLKDGGINLPISLSYHASGIRVAELASWVGLGWALNAGGVINRTVRGAPDEGSRKSGAAYAPGGYYIDHGLFGLTQALPYGGPDNGFTDQNGVLAAQNEFYQHITNSIMAGSSDTEPDLFTFNFNGHTGKFVFDEKGVPRLLEDDNLRINFYYNKNTNSFDYWVITTAEGVRYYFGENNAHETVLAHSNAVADNPDSGAPANWFLTKIYNPNTKETAIFNYVSESYSYHDLGPESILFGGSGTPAINYGCQINSINNYSVDNFLTSTVKGVRLSNIVTNNFKIVFNATNARTDLNLPNSNQPACSLDNIQIYTNQDNLLIKQLNLSYSYFTSTSATSQAITNSGIDDTDTRRLKLLSVKEVSGDGSIQKPPYMFTYQESLQLPRRLCYDQDHWGFANFSNGTHNSYFTIVPGSYITCNNIGSGAYRHAQWPDMSAYTLTSIKDPLGASTNFNYEPNSANNSVDPQTTQQDSVIGGLRVHQIAVTDNVTGTIKYREFSYKSFNTATTSGIVRHSPIYMLTPYSDYYSKYVVNAIRTRFDAVIDGGYVGQYYTGSPVILQILRQSQSVVPMQDANGNHIMYANITEYFGLHGEGGHKNYTFNTPDIGDPTNVSVNSRLSFTDMTGSYTMTTSIWAPNQTTDPVTQTLGNGPLNDTIASPNMLPVKLHYSNDYYECHAAYPFVPDQVDLTGNKLLEEDTFDISGNPIEKVTNTYNTVYHENFWIRGLKVYVPLYTPALPYNALSFYKLHTGASHLISKTIHKNYNGSNFITETTNYSYSSPYHNLQTTESTTDSQGNQLLTQNYYSFDYANSATSDNVIGKMKTRNMLMPIRSDNWKNGSLVGEKITKFTDFATSIADTLINPANIYSLETKVPLTPAQASESIAWTAPLTTLIPNSQLFSKVNFVYDGSTGKLSNQQLTNNRSQGVMWSSQQKLPVALVDNAANTPTLEEFYYEGFEENTASNVYLGLAHTGSRYVLSPYTVSWGLPNSRTYYITYWYLSGGIWNLQAEQAFTGSLALTGGTAYDDIRIYPKDAQMINYTYDAAGNLKSTMDAKGLTAYYEYDALQRLINIKDKDGNIVKSFCYNYASQSNGCNIYQTAYGNTTQSVTLSKSCNSGYTGSTITYTVPPAKYTSSTQAGADAQATAEIQANAQNNANASGICTLNVAFTASNSTNSGYQVNFTSGSVSQSYTLNNSGNTTIQVPSGTYTLDIYPSGAYNNHTFTLGSRAAVPGVPRTTFTNVNIATGSSDLTLTIN